MKKPILAAVDLVNTPPVFVCDECGETTAVLMRCNEWIGDRLEGYACPDCLCMGCLA